ncbi:MAG: response regulator transcription factor [Desulfobulbus sp.]
MTTDTPPATPTILLVEDDQALRESTTEYLSKTGYTVTAVGDGLHFFQALAAGACDAAIIDLGLPDMDGMRLVEYLHANSVIPCIILTARDDLEDRVLGYDSGADLYLIKPVDLRELASALGRLLRRVAEITPAENPSMHWCLSPRTTNLLTPERVAISLSYKELALLRCLITTPQQPVARAIIFESLGQRNDDFAHRALESLVRRLRRKIEQVTAAAPIQTCHGVGYAFAAPVILE